MASILNAQTMNNILPSNGTTLFFLSSSKSIWVGRVNLSQFLEYNFDVEVTGYVVSIIVSSQKKATMFKKDLTINKAYDPAFIRAEYTTDGFLTVSTPLKESRLKINENMNKTRTFQIPIQIVLAPLSNYTSVIQRIMKENYESDDD